jgi:hypothetical protein
VLIRKHIGRLCDDGCIDAASCTFLRDLAPRSGAKESFDRALPCRTCRGVERRAIVGCPINTTQRIRKAARIDPVAQALIGWRPESARHERVKTVAIGERPNATHCRAAVVQSTANAMQFAAIELPHQHTVHVARERDLLHGDVYMLPATGELAIPQCRIDAGSGDHVGMKPTGIKCLFDRCAIRISCQAQCATHGRGNEL